MKRLPSVLFVVSILTFVTRLPSASAEDAAQFYANNVTVAVVPYGAEGGVDFAARLFASYWSDVTGGSMIVKNKTGGGGLVGTNFAYNAKPDGKTIGTGILGATVLAPALLKESGVQFDVQKIQWFPDAPIITQVVKLSPEAAWG
jgi:tripartite-type tricarboxylate transporter receptor subunit TctC